MFRGNDNDEGSRVHYSNTHHKIRVIDLVTVLHNLLVGAKTENVGWESAKLSLHDLSVALGKAEIFVRESEIEEALWSCNLMSEEGKFWDVKERTFDQLIQSIYKGKKTFNKDYNFLVTKGE